MHPLQKQPRVGMQVQHSTTLEHSRERQVHPNSQMGMDLGKAQAISQTLSAG